MLSIETRIDPVEIDGEEVAGLPGSVDQLSVTNHWNSNRFVVLTFRSNKIAVMATDLERAIRNARNHD